MASTQYAKATTAPMQSRLAADETLSRPIVWWAAFGAAMIALSVVILGRWVMSDDFAEIKTNVAADPVAEWSAFGMQVFSVLLTLGFLAWIIRGCRREHRLTFDAMLVIGSASLLVWDPLINYFRVGFFYSSAFFNRGSWVNFISGWVSPNGQLLPEPLLAFSGVSYLSLTVLMIIGTCNLLRIIKLRFPTIGTGGLTLIAVAILAVFDLLLEPQLMRLTHLYAYPGAITSLTAFAGTNHQFPAYLMAMNGVSTVALGMLRYYRDDKGRSIVERGADSLRVSSGRQAVIRCLAIAGFLHAITLTYSALAVWTLMYSGPQPAALPDHLINGICGAATAYPCIGPDSPIVPPNGRAQWQARLHDK